MKVLRDDNGSTIVVCDNVSEITYNGKDMGDRSVTATILSPFPISFKIGDYIVVDLWDLSGNTRDALSERFYLYSEPINKKTSSKGIRDAFEYSATFYTRQYELTTTTMRDVFVNNVTSILYSGMTHFSFYGGAKTLLDRIIGVLSEFYKDDDGVSLWKYEIADSINEDINTALEKYQFDFDNTTCWDALCMINSVDKIRSVFYIVDRTIYVGFRRQLVKQVDNAERIINDKPFTFTYGKTSHLKLADHETYQKQGGLFNITKTINTRKPITRLYAYGGSRNLNRFYCSDRIRKGRYVNKLMLPTFERDGKTDYIDSHFQSKYGIRDDVKEFEEIYPSLKNITYRTLRDIRYCIMLSNDITDETSVAIVRCYKIETDTDDNRFTKLTPAYPEKPLAVCIHAVGKTIKCVLQDSYEHQLNQDSFDNFYLGNIPRDSNGNPIVGACYAVALEDFETEEIPLETNRYSVGLYRKDGSIASLWFSNFELLDQLTPMQKQYVELRQIHYTDDFWITDCYEYVSADQTTFIKDGYSVYCYPRITKNYQNSYDDDIPIDVIVDAQPVVIEDTDIRISNGNRQITFCIYTRDFGFLPDMQSNTGAQYYVIPGNTLNVDFISGYLAGNSFEAVQQQRIWTIDKLDVDLYDLRNDLLKYTARLAFYSYDYTGNQPQQIDGLSDRLTDIINKFKENLDWVHNWYDEQYAFCSKWIYDKLVSIVGTQKRANKIINDGGALIDDNGPILQFYHDHYNISRFNGLIKDLDRYKQTEELRDLPSADLLINEVQELYAATNENETLLKQIYGETEIDECIAFFDYIRDKLTDVENYLTQIRQETITTPELSEHTIAIPAYIKGDDGTWRDNPSFYRFNYLGELQPTDAKYIEAIQQAQQAVANGAFWRIELKRIEYSIDNSGTCCYLPLKGLNALPGDRFVLTNIYMPDVYIRAAEQKLEDRAKEYLIENENVDIQYSFDFDKVRMAQQQMLARQIREGMRMRISDEDVDVSESGYTMELLTKTFYERERVGVKTEIIDREIYIQDWFGHAKPFDLLISSSIVGTSTNALAEQQIDLRKKNRNAIGGYEHNYIKCNVTQASGGNWRFTSNFDYDIFTKYELWLRFGHFTYEVYSTPIDKLVKINKFIRFKSSRYYTIAVLLKDGIEDFDLCLALGQGASEAIYIPNIDKHTINGSEIITESDGITRNLYKKHIFKFYLPDSFNGDNEYRTAIIYHNVRINEPFTTALVSVVESNIDYNRSVINYSDQIIDSVSIKMTEYGNSVYRDIKATVKSVNDAKRKK